MDLFHNPIAYTGEEISDWVFDEVSKIKINQQVAEVHRRNERKDGDDEPSKLIEEGFRTAFNDAFQHEDGDNEDEDGR